MNKLTKSEDTSRTVTIKASLREREAWREAIVGEMPPTPDWKNTVEWAAVWGKSLSSTKHYLRQLLELNKMERRIFRPVIGGVVRPMPYHRLK